MTSEIPFCDHDTVSMILHQIVGHPNFETLRRRLTFVYSETQLVRFNSPRAHFVTSKIDDFQRSVDLKIVGPMAFIGHDFADDVRSYLFRG